MATFTASKTGQQNSLSATVLANSNTTLDVRLNGIDKADITAATYQFGGVNNPYVQKTIADGGITVGDNGLLISITASDARKLGKYKHYLEITDDTGTYQVFLNFGRIEFQ